MHEEEHGPRDPSLRPRDLQLFLKRLRKYYEPDRFRFFAVGEYGSTTERPHYHLAVFNFPTCRWLRTRSDKVHQGRSCCYVCDSVRDIWGKGHVYLGLVEDHSAQYIAQYVTKKLVLDPVTLNGRHDEFQRQSTRPHGIGFNALHDVASTFLQYDLESTQPDVPSGLRHGKKIKPLGRYLQRQLRTLCGRPEATPEEVIKERYEQMLPVRLAARASKDDPSIIAQLKKVNAAKIASIEARQKIFKQRNTI